MFDHHMDGGGPAQSSLEGMLVGVLKSPVSAGYTCIIEDGVTRATVMCNVRGYRKPALDRTVGSWVKLRGIARFDDNGKILRLDDVEILHPDLN